MMRNAVFPVRLRPNPDGGLIATFPDVPEAITFGDDRKDAIRSAQEAPAVAYSAI
jgi:antitoxin HicB